MLNLKERKGIHKRRNPNGEYPYVIRKMQKAAMSPLYPPTEGQQSRMDQDVACLSVAAPANLSSAAQGPFQNAGGRSWWPHA